MRTAQVLLTFFDMSARTHYLNARRTLQALLEWRIVPVINENDTTTTDEISFGDNDFLAAQVAVLLQARLLVLLTDTAGVFDADPRRDPGARLIDEITDFEALSALQIGALRLAAGVGRDALEGRRRGDGHRGGDGDDHLQRVRAGRPSCARRPASRSARAACRGRWASRPSSCG